MLVDAVHVLFLQQPSRVCCQPECRVIVWTGIYAQPILHGMCSFFIHYLYSSSLSACPVWKATACVWVLMNNYSNGQMVCYVLLQVVIFSFVPDVVLLVPMVCSMLVCHKHEELVRSKGLTLGGVIPMSFYALQISSTKPDVQNECTWYSGPCDTVQT